MHSGVEKRDGAGRKVQCARGIIIHPAHYPSTDTIDDPTPIRQWSLLSPFAFDEMEI